MLAAEGLLCQVVMVDGALVAPAAPLVAGWREARLRTPAGMITLQQEGDEVALVVFGNADAATLAIRERLARALGGA